MTHESEQPDSSCRDEQDIPTEGAVLRREYAALRARIDELERDLRNMTLYAGELEREVGKQGGVVASGGRYFDLSDSAKTEGRTQ